MKSIKEKQLIVKWSKAMNEPIDSQLLEEVERYEQIQSEIIESVRMNTINDLSEAAKVAEDVIEKINLEYPKPPTLEELLSVIKEEQDELVQAQSEKILIPEETITSASTDTETIVEVPKGKSLVNYAVEQITKEEKLHEKSDSFQQPDPAPTNKNLTDLVKKLKFLEQAIGKIAATGPGSGSYWLYDLGDVHYDLTKNPNDGEVLTYNQANAKWEPAVSTGGGGGSITKIAGVTSGQVSNNQLTLGVISSGILYTANISEVNNLFYTNARVSANVATLGYSPNTYVNLRLLTKANVADLNTSNVNEGTNLYFTNSRAVGAFTAGQSIFIDSNGLITSNATGGGGAVNSVNGLTGTVTLYTANIAESGNLYFTNERSISAFTAGQGIVLEANGLIVSTATGTVTGVNGQTGNVSLTTSNITEGLNLYFTNTRSYDNIVQIGYITSSALNGYATNSQLSLYATNAQLADYATNNQLALYATNSQLASYATNAQLSVYATNNQLSIYATNNQLQLYATNAQLANYATNNQLTLYATNVQISTKANISDLTTANISEISNLYFTNVRVYDNVTQIGYITPSSLVGYATNNQLDLYATNAQLSSYATNAQLATYATNAQLATYATNAQLATYATNAQLALYSTNVQLSLKANISDLNTSNVNEGSNLYFTNSRAVGSLTAGQNISIASNGRITAEVTGGGSSVTTIQFNNTNLDFYSTKTILSLNKNTFRSAEYNFFIEELGNYTRKSQQLIHNGTILSYSNSSVSVGTVNVETYFYLQNNDLILQALSTSASYVDDYFLLSDGYQSNTTINLKGHVFLIEA